ncbi:hypothetical protein ABZW96_27580 [Nocardia sp. NPDC004168]|uniref:hypothetical protein n=1 Tax=Nocardia sp. NPDC004168 TaxID=3154452 RepID=UPI0033BAD89B
MRIVGVILIAIISIFTLIQSAARDRLSVTKLLVTGAGALLAGAMVWMLPTLIYLARDEAQANLPVYTHNGGYR